LPENELKPRKKGAKKAINRTGLNEIAENLKPVKKKSRKKKTVKKVKAKSKKRIRKVPLESKAFDAVEKTLLEPSQNITAPPQNIISNPVEKVIEPDLTRNQNPIPIINFQNTLKTKFFIIFSIYRLWSSWPEDMFIQLRKMILLKEPLSGMIMVNMRGHFSVNSTHRLLLHWVYSYLRIM